MVMRTLLVLLAVLVVAHSGVVVLDDSNYTSFVEEHPYVFVKFYAPWCGHCKSMAPDYIKLAEASEGKEYVIAEVDATIATNVSAQVGVEGYPTLKFIVNGYPLEYVGSRNFEGMQQWLQTTMTSKINKVTEQKVKEMIGSADFVLIQGASSQQLQSLRFAEALGGIKYYAIEEGEFKITLHLKNSKTFEYGGAVNIKDLAEWALHNSMGSLVALTSSEVIRHVFENKKQLPSFLLLRNKDWTDALSDTLREFCEQNVDKFVCAFADQSHEIHKGISRFMKTENDEVSVLAYFDFGIKNGWKVPTPTQITKESLAQFLEDVTAGNVEKFHGGEKAEEDHKPSKIEYVNVIKLTNETYNDTLKNNKFVFVEYYSPSCGHCARFAPDYEKLATQLKESNSEFVIAAVDMSVEDEVASWVNVNGYPTLRFYIDGSEIDYTGERDVESIISFMTKAKDHRLPTINTIEDIERPAVAVFGIDETSILNLLPLKFSRFPVYLVLEKSEFKVEVHEKKFARYTGDSDLDAVANWLEETTESVIVNVVEEYPGKKLNKALENQTPLLVIVNRDDSEAFKAAFSFLEGFCDGKVEFVCGIASKGDKQFDGFNSWISDPKNEESRLLYLDTKQFAKYLYDGDLAALNEEIVTKFLSDIKEGNIKAHQAVEEFQEKEEQGQATQGETAEEPQKSEETAQPTETVEEVEQTEEAQKENEEL